MLVILEGLAGSMYRAAFHSAAWIVLLLKEGRWYAYDLIADGMSLVKNYRSQFQKVIRDSSYHELVKKLRERALSGETKAMP